MNAMRLIGLLLVLALACHTAPVRAATTCTATAPTALAFGTITTGQPPRPTR